MADNQQNHDQEFRQEYAHIKRDVLKVIIINGVFLALLIGLYFANREYGFLDKIKLF